MAGAGTCVSARADRAGNTNKLRTFSTLSFTGTYMTGGMALTAAQLGLSTVDYAVPVITNPAGAAIGASYDTANSKLILYSGAGQVADDVDISSVTFQIIAFGS